MIMYCYTEPPTLTKAVPRELNVSLESLPPLEPHHTEAVMGGENTRVGDNDMSAQTPETPLEDNRTVSMQTNPPPSKYEIVVT